MNFFYEPRTFFVALIISALGSIPLGSINITSFQISFKYGLVAAGLFIGLAVFAEIPHLWLSTVLNHLFIYEVRWTLTFKYLALVYIIVLGIYHILKKTGEEKTSKRFSWKYAWTITLLNPFSIPFWVFFVEYALHEHWIMPSFSLENFIAGACTGTLIILFLYAFIGFWVEDKAIFQKIHIDKWIGIIYIILGLFQAISLFYPIKSVLPMLHFG